MQTPTLDRYASTNTIRLNLWSTCNAVQTHVKHGDCTLKVTRERLLFSSRSGARLTLTCAYLTALIPAPPLAQHATCTDHHNVCGQVEIIVTCDLCRKTSRPRLPKFVRLLPNQLRACHNPQQNCHHYTYVWLRLIYVSVCMCKMNVHISYSLSATSGAMRPLVRIPNEGHI